MSRLTLVFSPLDLISSHTPFSHLPFVYPRLSPGTLDGRGAQRRERALRARLRGVSTFSTWSLSLAPPYNYRWSSVSGTLPLLGVLGRGTPDVPHLRLVYLLPHVHLHSAPCAGSHYQELSKFIKAEEEISAT